MKPNSAAVVARLNAEAYAHVAQSDPAGLAYVRHLVSLGPRPGSAGPGWDAPGVSQGAGVGELEILNRLTRAGYPLPEASRLASAAGHLQAHPELLPPATASGAVVQSSD